MTRLVPFLIAALFMVGCAGQATGPSHYLLRSPSNLDSRELSPSLTYSLGTVAIAPYIDQPGLVLETQDGEVHVARNHLWAEPVYEGVRNHLMVTLSDAIGQDILTDSLISTPVVIDVRVDQMHGTAQGTAKLVAYWWLRRDGELVAAHRFAEELPLAQDGYRALVTAEETLLTQLAGAIADSLTATTL